MKFLLAIPFLFSIAACAPVKEKIEDRTGGCVNGNCVNQQSPKPRDCEGAAQFSSLSGTFKSKPVTSIKTGITYSAQFIFSGNKVMFTQFCENLKTGEFESPQVETTYSVNSSVTALKFDKPQANEVESESFVCKAELTAETFAVSPQGKCLVMKPSKGDALYYVKQGN